MKWEEYSVDQLVNEIADFDLDYVIRTMVKAEDLLRDLENKGFPTAGTFSFKYQQLENARKDMTKRKENIDRVFKKLFEVISKQQSDMEVDARAEEERKLSYREHPQDRPPF